MSRRSTAPSIPQREAKRRRVAGEEKKAEAEEAKEPVIHDSFASSDPTGAARAIIRHRKAKERFEKREREAKERAAAEKKKAKAAEVAAHETVDADELRRLEMEQREAKERAAAEKKKAAKLAYKAAEQASWMTQIEIDLARQRRLARLGHLPCVT